MGRSWSSSLWRASLLGKILINFAYNEMIWTIVHRAVVNYNYDHDLVVSITMISDLPIVEAQISMIACHHCVNYCAYSIAIDRHPETMDHFRHRHRHQAHHGILRADYLSHSACELGHVLIEHRRYLVACHSDQI